MSVCDQTGWGIRPPRWLSIELWSLPTIRRWAATSGSSLLVNCQAWLRNPVIKSSKVALFGVSYVNITQIGPEWIGPIPFSRLKRFKPKRACLASIRNGKIWGLPIESVLDEKIVTKYYTVIRRCSGLEKEPNWIIKQACSFFEIVSLSRTNAAWKCMNRK